MCVYKHALITLHRLLDKGVMYWQFTWHPYIYPDHTYEREILDNHKSVFCSVGISSKYEELDLPY